MRSQINRKNVKERGKRDKRKNHKLKPDRCSKKKKMHQSQLFSNLAFGEDTPTPKQQYLKQGKVGDICKTVRLHMVFRGDTKLCVFMSLNNSKAAIIAVRSQRKGH